MQGSLTLHRGLLFVGRHARTAEVRSFDLDGRVRPAGFTFRDRRVGRSMAAGLDLDDEGRVWVADTPASRVRLFTLFGQEVGGLGISNERALADFDERDEAGVVRQPVDVIARGNADGLELVVASGGTRRHAVQVFDEHLRLVRSLRPLGDPRGRFRGVRRIARRGRFLFVLEREAQRIQVFRDLEFHFAFRPDPPRSVPTALAALHDGRLVIGCGGPHPALLVCDPTGRLLRTLAHSGNEEGSVTEIEDLTVDEAPNDRDSRILSLDADGDRVQVFTLEGRCFGAFQHQA